MRKLALAFVLASSGLLGGVAHAGAPHHIVGPTTKQLKTFLKSQAGTPVARSTAKNSLYYRFNAALATKPSDFRKIKLTPSGPDHGSTAYIPKVYIKGLPGNTAFISSQTIAGPMLRKTALPAY